ncbi:MAG: sensor histidine kinase [Eubacteriales bacterium]|nr:sensor histidine kinase [Eubacteriales bacterium]
MKKSLQNRFVVFYLLLVALPAFLLMLLFMARTTGYVKDMEGYSEKASFRQTSQLLEYYMANINENVNTLIGQDEFHKIIEKDNEGESRQDQIQDMLTMQKMLGSCRGKAEISDVYLYVDNTAIYIGENAQIRNLSDAQEEPWYAYAESGFSDGVLIPSSYMGKDTVVGYAKAVKSAKNYSKMVGIIVLELNKTLLTSYLGSEEEAQIFLMNAQGERLTQNVEDCAELSGEELLSNADGESHMVMVEKNSYYLYAKELEKTGWYLVFLQPSEIMRKMLWQQAVPYLLFFSLILALGFGFFWFFFRFCFSRITAITAHMAGIREELPPPMETGKRGDEIDEMIAAYNYMLERVDGLLHEQYELGNQIKEIEMKALYAQINPHFLYNTLTMINWLAEDGQTEDVTRVIMALSDFYRLSLNKGSENISLSEELKIAKNFVYIQQMRFGTDIRLECRVDPIYEEFVLPKLTLQPLIENALVHGILKRRDKSGCITILASDRDGVLTLQVADDGIGMEEETARMLNDGTYRDEGKHYGVWNVVQRVSLYFQAECTLSVESRKGEGTKVELAIPYTNTMR